MERCINSEAKGPHVILIFVQGEKERKKVQKNVKKKSVRLKATKAS